MCQALSMIQEPHKRLIIHEELMPACRHFPPLRALLFVWDVSSTLVCSVSLRLSLAITFSQPQKLGLVAYNFSTQGAKARESKFEASLGCILKPYIR